MTYNITEVTSYDHKRNKVTLDYGEVTFLLYKGECRSLHIVPGETGILEDAAYQTIMKEILLPRAKKKIMYYLKNADKTRSQIRQKLKEGFYPDAVIDETFAFLDKYGFADDGHYAEEYISSQRGLRSRREIEMKLMQKGIRGSELKDFLSEISEEEEYAACDRLLRKKYSGPIEPENYRKAYAYLAGKGFSPNMIQRAVRALQEDA